MSAASHSAWALLTLGLAAAAVWVGNRRNQVSGDRGQGSQPEAEDEMDAQLSMIEAMEGREEILSAVAERNKEWLGTAIAALEKLPLAEGVGQEFREALIEAGLEEPKVPQAWGTMFNNAGKLGIIAKTGEWRPMRRKDGRLSPVYRRVIRDEVAA